MQRSGTKTRGKCPMLGVPGDTEKHYLYPFGGNVCYACAAGIWKYGAISDDRQREYCLSGGHECCPSYQKCIGGEPAALKPSSWFQKAVTLWRMRARDLDSPLMGIGSLYLEEFKAD